MWYYILVSICTRKVIITNVQLFFHCISVNKQGKVRQCGSAIIVIICFFFFFTIINVLIVHLKFCLGSFK